jgi:hypothetical protein
MGALYANCQLALMGIVWHWSHPPGGGIAFQAVNMAQPQIRKTEKKQDNQRTLRMGFPFNKVSRT